MKIYRNRLGRAVWWAVLLLVAGLVATGLAVRSVKATLDRETEQNFKIECEVIQAKVEVRIRAHEQVLRSAAAFFSDTDGVSREEFHEFAERQKIYQVLPGIQGIGFAKLLPRAQLA
ncbi:MAG: CHASE domain-containing protein, partial [Verrucomicrobiota bacterium]